MLLKETLFVKKLQTYYEYKCFTDNDPTICVDIAQFEVYSYSTCAIRYSHFL